MAGMTQTDHRAAALAALDRSRQGREAIAREYAKPVPQRDYNRIGDLRTAIRADLLEAQVQAALYTGALLAAAVDTREACGA